MLCVKVLKFIFVKAFEVPCKITHKTYKLLEHIYKKLC